MSQRRALTLQLLQQENNLSDELLDQRIPKEKLFDIAGLLPNWYDYAGTPGLGLTDGEKLTIRQDVFLSMNRLKAHRALEIWYDRNPYIATYRFILELCLQRQHGDVAINIVRELLLGYEVVDHPVATLMQSVADTTGPGLYEHVASSDTIQHSHSGQFDETSLVTKSQKVLQKEFSVLFSCLRRALREKRISGSDLMSHLEDMDIFGPIEPMFRTQHLPFRDAATTVRPNPTIDHVFHLMAPYCSWFNHLLVESIIDVYFSDNETNMVHERFAGFKRKFDKYCKDRHLVVKLDYGPAEDEGTTVTVFKIDKHYDNIRIEHLPKVVNEIAEALGVQNGLILRTVKNGCLELSIAMSTHKAEQLFPIEEEALRALHKRNVVKYVQGAWVCDIESVLQGIDQNKQTAAQVQSMFKESCIHPEQVPLQGTTPVQSDTARMIAEKLQQIGDNVNEEAEQQRSSLADELNFHKKMTGLWLAHIGEKIQKSFFEQPEESLMSRYGGQMLLSLGIVLPGLLDVGAYANVFRASGIALALGWQYYRRQKYPHNRAIKKTIHDDVSAIFGVGVTAALGYTLFGERVERHIVLGYVMFMLAEMSGINRKLSDYLGLL